MRRLLVRAVSWLWMKLVGVQLQGHPENACEQDGCYKTAGHDGPHDYPADPVEAGTMSRNNPL